MSSRDELAALVEELAGPGARHPAWRLLVNGVALLEGLGRLRSSKLDENVYATYLSANGSPRSDTFLARDRAGDDRTLAERCARAVLRARAAALAIATLDGQLPEQPLWRALSPRRGWLRRVEVSASAPAAAFVTPRGVVVGELDGPRALARELAALCAGRTAGGQLRRVDGEAAVSAAIAVDLSPQPAESARHLHRRAWSEGGGPWLGVGETRELELVTTCHLAVDGYGHARIASEIFAALDRVGEAEWGELVSAGHEGAAGAAAPPWVEAEPVAGAMPLGFAGEVVEAPGLRFAQLAYACARTLQILHERTPDRGRLAPTLQVTLAPGDRDDPERRRRRVRFALLPPRGSAAEAESFEGFAARLRELVERENQRPGLLMRVLAATATAPLPMGLRRTLLSSEGKPRPSMPPVEVLGGRASLSFMRFGAAETPAAPMYGLSSPGLVATEDDPLGSFVVTAIHHGPTCTVSIGGTGVAGDAGGAREVLGVLIGELRRTQSRR